MELFLYFAKVSACTAIFYFFYHFVLARFTFFNLNRWYLIGTLILSFMIPLMSITIKKEVAVPAQSVIERTSNVGISNVQGNSIDPEFSEESNSSMASISISDILLAMYVAVFAFFLMRLFVG